MKGAALTGRGKLTWWPAAEDTYRHPTPGFEPWPLPLSRHQHTSPHLSICESTHISRDWSGDEKGAGNSPGGLQAKAAEEELQHLEHPVRHQLHLMEIMIINKLIIR